MIFRLSEWIDLELGKRVMLLLVKEMKGDWVGFEGWIGFIYGYFREEKVLGRLIMIS